MLENPKKEKKKKAAITFVIALSIPAVTEIVLAIAKICLFVYKNYPH